MKKGVVAFISMVVVALSLVVTAYAHSGRTDSQGGHYDRSTGEYHWHHGMSAHQHYDMDGDGILDCPYSSKAKTETTTATTAATEPTRATTAVVSNATESGKSGPKKNINYDAMEEVAALLLLFSVVFGPTAVYDIFNNRKVAKELKGSDRYLAPAVLAVSIFSIIFTIVIEIMKN